MRKASGAVVAMILAIALYFTLFWGFEALRVLTSPSYGLEDVWRSQFVFGIGRAFNLGPEGLIKLAAFFGALKLIVAGVCGVHVLDRMRSLIGGGTADTEILETGLMLVLAVSIAAVGPAIWSQNAELVRELTIQILLAGVAAAACIVERMAPDQAVIAETTATTEPVPAKATADAAVKDTTWFTPWR
jgi:hypothetical protein